MKKALTALLCAGMVFSLAACSSANQGTSEETAASESEAAETTEGGETAADETEETVKEVYAYEYDVKSMVTLGDYKNLTYTIQDTTVTDDEIQSEIDSVIDSYTEDEQITDRAVAEGDNLNVTIEGYLPGQEDDPFQTAYTTDIVVGSAGYIEGFEEQLIGMEMGDNQIEVTFPDPYENNTDLSGKDAIFKLTLNYIHGDAIVPELNDEFVAALGVEGVSTVDEYKAYLKEELQASKESEAESAIQEELLDAIVASSTVNEFPEDLVNVYVSNYKDYYSSYASQFGYALEDFITASGTTMEEFEASAQEYGQNAAGAMLVMAAVAASEGYEVTDEVYAQKLAEYAEKYAYENGEALESEYGARYIKQVIIADAVDGILKGYATGVEAAETEAAETEAE